MGLWKRLKTEFEELKGRKQILLVKDETLEKKSKDLNGRFEKKRKTKETITKKYKNAKSTIMQVFEMLQQNKISLQKNAGMLVDKFEKVSSEKNSVDKTSKDLEQRYLFILIT